MRLFTTCSLWLVALALVLSPPVQAQHQLDTPEWTITPADVTWMSTASTVRGGAVNPATGNLLIPSREAPLSVQVINAATGAVTGQLDVTGVEGGTFVINKIAATSDGQIFASNLVSPAGAANQLKIYRWANEASAPTVVYQGVPSEHRYGDAFNVSGSGGDVVAYSSGSGNANLAIFTMDQGMFEAPSILALPAAGAAQTGIVKAAGQDSLWINNPVGGTLRKISSVTGVVGTEVPTSVVHGHLGELAQFSIGDRLFLAVGPGRHDEAAINESRVLLLDVTDIANIEVVAETFRWGTTDNRFAPGGFVTYDEASNLLIAGVTQNAIQAFSLDFLLDDPEPELPAYWAFNDGGTNPQAWPPPVNADEGYGFITHTFTVEGTAGHSSFAGTTLNALEGYASGGSFVPQGQHNNGNHFTIHTSTTGYENLVISYATQRTSTGFTSQAFAYSVDGGDTYIDIETVTDLPGSFEVRQVALPAEADDQADLRIRVTVDGATSAGGNNRFDNLALGVADEPVGPIAEFTPPVEEGLSVMLAPGESTVASLVISNTGDETLSFAIEQDGGERDGHDANLDEALDVPAFSVTGAAGGGEAVVYELPAGVTSSGTVVGFSFEGTVAGISGQGDWASDMRLVITSPSGASFNVGGFSGVVNPWNFQGSGSANDGTYQSTHFGVFGDDGTGDAGDWTLTFVHGWNSDNAGTMNWSDVTVTLHKAGGDAPVGPFVTEVSPAFGSVEPGATVEVAVTFDATGYEAGSFEDYLTIWTNEVADEALAGMHPEKGSAIRGEGYSTTYQYPVAMTVVDAATSLVQVIHNAPDPAAAAVDVYVDGGLLAGNFGFREATPFVALTEGSYQVTITLAGEAAAVIYDESLFVPGGLNIQLIASGVADPAQFPSNPDEIGTAFEILVNADAATEAPAGEVSLTAVHGSPDAPTVSVAARGVGTLFGPFAYTAIEGPADVPAGSYVLDVQADGQTVVSFEADLSGAGGLSATVLASGFLNPDGGPEGTEGFGLLVVLADGTTFMLPLAPEVVSIAEARALGVGETVTVRGTVSRAKGAFTYFQDDTGGLAIRQTSGGFFDAVADGTITTGTEIEARGTISAFRGLLQFNTVDLLSWEILDQGDAPEPIEYSLAELQDADLDDIQARLVEVRNLTIDTADPVFLAAKTYFVSDFSIGEDTFQLRTPNAADTDVDGTPVPPEFFTFTGVVGWFDAPQLLAILETDIEFQEVNTEGNATPVAFDLKQNYPNPFSSSTAIEYHLPQSAPVMIAVYDLTGRRVATLVDQEMEAGIHTATWNANGVASGVYLYRIQAGSFHQTLRALVVR